MSNSTDGIANGNEMNEGLAKQFDAAKEAASAMANLGTSAEAAEKNRVYAGEKTQEDPTNDNAKEDHIPMSFPQKLMDILADEGNSEIVSWLPHGRGFMIYHKKRFALEVLPKYFKRTKFTSFTRKLNRWGFHRVTRGTETGAYYHDCFQRGNLRLCMQMCCQNSDKRQSKLQKTINHGHAAQQQVPGRLNMNMSRLQITPTFGTMGPSSIGAAAIDPNILLLQQQLERQRQELFMQQQQQHNWTASLAQPQLPNQPQDSLGTQGTTDSSSSSAVARAPVSSPALGSLDENSRYSRGVVNAAIHALERNKQNNYLSMLMAQEKAQVPMLGATSPEAISLQRQQAANLLLAQQQHQQQFDLITKQRMMQAAAGNAVPQPPQDPQEFTKLPPSVMNQGNQVVDSEKEDTR